MKVVLTSRREITAKKTGEQYVIYSAVKPNGEMIQAFVKPENDSLPAQARPSEDAVASLFTDGLLPVVEVVFNELGRVESISEVED